MADQISGAPHNEDLFRVEQLLLSDDNGEGINPLLDAAVNGMMDEIGNHGINLPENMCNETSQSANLPQPPIRIPVWPVPPSPYSCSCCQTLREIFHVNGSGVLKLAIHGRLGVISHGVLESYDSNASMEDHEFYMFDFCRESISNVKQFLVDYCNARRLEGYTLLQDPLSNFYDALCTGLDVHKQTGQEGQPEEEGIPKTYIASQRERAGKMSLKDLEKYFHLPISAASKEMNLCPSAIKSICRKGGLKRWPHRKIKSIMTEVSKKQHTFNSADDSDKPRLLVEIQQLQRKLDNFYQQDS